MIAEHYFSKKPKSTTSINSIKFRVRGREFVFFTASSLFSKKHLDKGTELLLESVIVKDGWSVLDLGCGYGVVGITIKKLFPKCSVVMSDINERAVIISKKNAHFNNAEVIVLQSNLYDRFTQKFNTIICNPPQKAGKEVCFVVIEQAPRFLEPQGTLQIVARHNKGGKTLENKMKEVFGNVTVLAKKGGFRVYSSKKQN